MHAWYFTDPSMALFKSLFFYLQQNMSSPSQMAVSSRGTLIPYTGPLPASPIGHSLESVYATTNVTTPPAAAPVTGANVSIYLSIYPIVLGTVGAPHDRATNIRHHGVAQFQTRPIPDVIFPSFSLSASPSPSPYSALEDCLGKSRSSCDMPMPLQMSLCLLNCHRLMPSQRQTVYLLTL